MKSPAIFLLPLLACSGLAHAQSGGGIMPMDDDDSGSFVKAGMLPDGSILQNVTLPSYDDKLRIAASLHARQLTIHNKRTDIEGNGITIDFFSSQQVRSGTMRLEIAHFNPTESILTTRTPFTLLSDTMNAMGTSLIYDIRAKRGFINGPVVADAVLERDTAMNKPIRNPLALGAILVAAATFAEAVPPVAKPTHSAEHDEAIDGRALVDRARMTPEQLKQIEEQSATARPMLEGARQPALDAMRKGDEDAFKARNALSDFATHIALTTLASATEAPESDEGPVPPPPVLVGPKTHITADDGVFVDREKGIMVFLKNVRVKDESEEKGGFGQMSGADELKVIFKPAPPKSKEEKAKEAKEQAAAKEDVPSAPRDPSKPPTEEEQRAAKEKSKKDSGDTASFGGGMGDIERIIATGKVMLLKKADKAGDPDTQAYGRTVIYEPGTKEVLIKGDSPWIISPQLTVRVLGPNGYIRYNMETGSGIAAGGQLDGNFYSKPKEDKDKPKTGDKPAAPSGTGARANPPASGGNARPTPPRPNNPNGGNRGR